MNKKQIRIEAWITEGKEKPGWKTYELAEPIELEKGDVWWWNPVAKEVIFERNGKDFARRKLKKAASKTNIAYANP